MGVLDTRNSKRNLKIVKWPVQGLNRGLVLSTWANMIWEADVPIMNRCGCVRFRIVQDVCERALDLSRYPGAESSTLKQCTTSQARS